MVGMSSLLGRNGNKRAHRMMMIEIEMEDMIRWTTSYAVVIRCGQEAATFNQWPMSDAPDTPFLPTSIP